jgi:hypothetical protein
MGCWPRLSFQMRVGTLHVALRSSTWSFSATNSRDTATFQNLTSVIQTAVTLGVNDAVEVPAVTLAATASPEPVIAGRANVNGRSFRSGRIRSRQRRKACISPSLASASMASVAAFRLPLGLPAGLPDLPGLNACRAVFLLYFQPRPPPLAIESGGPPMRLLAWWLVR